VWADLPLVSILPSQCQAEHARIASSAGKVAANKTLRDFRATWNLALRKADNPDAFPRACPVASVTFHRERRREDAVIIDLPGWFARVRALGNPLRAVMHEFGLLSGLRPGNLSGIRREWIDLPRVVIRFPADVMKARVAFALPLSVPMVDLVRRALELGEGPLTSGRHGDWLFPAISRDGREVIATANWTERTLAANECGHALRAQLQDVRNGGGRGRRRPRAPARPRRAWCRRDLPARGRLLEHLREQQARVSTFILSSAPAKAAT
jgi:integrase